jgi:hypothetical protein
MIEDPEKFKEIAEKLQYFELPTNKLENIQEKNGNEFSTTIVSKCRALTYDRDFIGAENKTKI